MSKPVIEPRGNKVYWTHDGTSRTYTRSSVEAALDLAEQLERDWEEDQAKRAVLVAKYSRGTVAGSAGDVQTGDGTPPPPAVPSPEPAPEPEPEPPAEPKLPTVIVETAYLPDVGKLEATITVDEDTLLWRTVGGTTSTFTAKPGGRARRWSAAVGDDVEIRVGDDDGQIVHSETIR